MPVVEYFEEVASRVIVEVDETPVIEDEKVGSGAVSEEPGVATIGLGDGEFLEEARESQIACGVPVAAGFVSECAGEPGLADSGQASDILMRITSN